MSLESCTVEGHGRPELVPTRHSRRNQSSCPRLVARSETKIPVHCTSISYSLYVLPPAYAIRQDSRGGGVNMALSFRTGGVVCAENRSTIRQRTAAAVCAILIQNHNF